MKKVILLVLLPIIMNAQTTNVGSRLLGSAPANNDYFWVGLQGTNYQEPKSLGIGVEPQSNNSSFVRSLHFVTDGNYRMTIASEGNVGIGIINPQYKLHVYGGNIKAVNFDQHSGISIGAVATERPQLGFHVSDNSKRFKIELNSVNQINERLGFFTVNGGAWPETEVFSIIKNGNVGIGTTNPTSKLTVDGDIGIPSFKRIKIGYFFNIQEHIKLENNYDRALIAQGLIWDNDNNRYDLTTNQLYNRNGMILGNDGVKFFAHEGNVSNNPSWTQAELTSKIHLFVGNTGNTGIGTTAPEAKLDINGDLKVVNGGKFIGQAGSWYNGNQILFDFVGNTYGRIQSFNGSTNSPMPLTLNPIGGNVGIGNSNPIAKLDVNGITTFGIRYIRTDAQDARISVGDNSGKVWSWATGWGGGTSGDFSLIEEGVSGNRIYVQKVTGNVGINTSKPKTTLDVNGDVGIGLGTTIFPTGYKLAVAGNVIAEKVKVKKSNTWPDYVFSPTYQLPTLITVEKFVKQNRHLPEIPSAIEIEKEGQDLGEMNRLLLKKVEELTLYLIEIEKKNKEQDILIQKLLNK